MSQLLAGHARSVRLFGAAFLFLAAGCGQSTTSNKGSTSPSGGEVLVSVHTEPRNFGRFDPREATGDLVALLMHGSLIRINHVTDDIEPWLAESWTKSP